MFVCSCHAVSDRILREAVAAGLSHEEIVASTHAGSECGRCREAVAELVKHSQKRCGGASACPECPRRGTA